MGTEEGDAPGAEVGRTWPHARGYPPPQLWCWPRGWLVAVAEHEIDSCCHSRSSNIEGPAYRKGKKLMVVMATVENTLELPPPGLPHLSSSCTSQRLKLNSDTASSPTIVHTHTHTQPSQSPLSLALQIARVHLLLPTPFAWAPCTHSHPPKPSLGSQSPCVRAFKISLPCFMTHL